VATAIAGSREGGRDAVQEALARTLARRSTFRGAGPVEAWLWRAVVNAARNVRARSALVAESPHADVAAADSVDEHRGAIRAACLPRAASASRRGSSPLSHGRARRTCPRWVDANG
jgi:DNA-directed RNA polymerase specialized sigma24 family protein